MLMNIFEKLQKMRVELQNKAIKKSGENKFAGYNYYELGDFLPEINNLMNENKVTSVVSFDNDLAILKMINAEKPEEEVIFSSPMAEANLKGAHAIQNLGAVETYQRRYLYMVAFEIVENDVVDAQRMDVTNNNSNKQKAHNPSAPQQENGKHIITGKKHNNEAIEDVIKVDRGFVEWVANTPTHKLNQVAIELLKIEPIPEEDPEIPIQYRAFLCPPLYQIISNEVNKLCDCIDCSVKRKCLNYMTTECEECDEITCINPYEVINDCGENKKHYIKHKE